MGSSVATDELSVAKNLTVRTYAPSDLRRVEELERKCETGNGSTASLRADLLGDPLGRVRHFPAYEMLVAELQDEIVGVVRAGVKEVVCHKETINAKLKVGISPLYAKIGYLCGLRVSPTHRRLRIAMRLVMKMEDWCKQHGAEYVYVATVKDNEPSVKLFNEKLQYIPFRTPVILIHPVFVHPRPIPADVKVLKISPTSATLLYRSVLGAQEFFPKDIDAVLGSKLCAGTWVARMQEDELLGLGRLCNEGPCKSANHDECWTPCSGTERAVKPGSWAMLSIWKCNEIFSLEVTGVSRTIRALAAASRLADWALPGFGVPSIPNLFTPFGMHFMFGLHAEGPRAAELLSALCWHVHNLALRNGCGVVMSEVGAQDPLRNVIPHWKVLSSADDLWSVKRLQKGSDRNLTESVAICNRAKWLDNTILCDGNLDALTDPNLALEPLSGSDLFDWCSSAPSSSLFVDPRDV